MSSREGLVVVVPKGFDPGKVPAIIEANRVWIDRARRRVEARRPTLGAEAASLPRRILLPATGEEWEVEYREGSPQVSGVTLRVSSPTASREPRLILRGRVDDSEACRGALCRWLTRRARAVLVPRLSTLAAEHGLWFDRVSIRHQRSRWGSCSRRRTISLNARLLFFPPDLVDYVLLHELCHTVEMNHSPRFWRVLEEHHPGSAEYRRRLRGARGLVPEWLDAPLAGPPAPSALPWGDL
jgi:predicted metal-dependent hydrolase